MNAEGDVIKRWTGYTGGAKIFVNTLQKALGNLLTIDQRVAEFQKKPSSEEALFLAGYFSDKGEHLKAVDYYRRALELRNAPGYDYSFQIFQNMANAVWKDMADFDEALPTADTVLNSKVKSTENVIKVAQLMARLARKTNRTGDIAKYLQAGIDAAAADKSGKWKASCSELKADYALHVSADTTTALRLKKESLGAGWEKDRDKFYAFANWCLERKIDLEEAEEYARKTVNLVYPGRIRAMVLNTLAEICAARGHTEEAVKIIKLAIDQEPRNEFYSGQLEKFQKMLEEEK
jgi:tetratricopeptide (TPR) repeat protein